MEILRRTQGIDLKSKNSCLMGIAEIELRDALTGKVKEHQKKKNMLTNALDSMLNGCPYALDSTMCAGIEASVKAKQTPVINYGLGGIILFPASLGTDADMLYPDFNSNYPTGYASVESYTQEDSRQGAYDAVSSGVITGGYKHVYTWGSSFGNGTISALALSHRNAYKYFNDINTAVVRNDQYGSKTLRVNSINGYMNIIGANSRGIYLNNGQESYGAFPTGAKIWRWNKAVTAIDLLFDSYSNPTELDPIWEYPAYGFFCVEEDYIYFVHVKTQGTTSTIDFYTVDLSDNSSSKQTLSISANLLGSGGHQSDTFAKRGNYIYLFKNDDSAIYKINITNVADVTEIALPSGISNPHNYGMSVVKGIIFGHGFVIGNDDTARASTGFNAKIFDSNGVWSVVDNGANGIICGGLIAPFCATHANLENAVQKTADKQMVVNYSILQV